MFIYGCVLDLVSGPKASFSLEDVHTLSAYVKTCNYPVPRAKVAKQPSRLLERLELKRKMSQEERVKNQALARDLIEQNDISLSYQKFVARQNQNKRKQRRILTPGEVE